ncbi:MAG: ribose 5-phosphate isomerase [Microgenomates group bacterium Gr01-1014_5]|nr:MAG: ribose 5-phosphate isomerase [Microgenomates group bacterium Gr01-1014_5]
MKVYIGADHGGYALKESLKEHLSEFGTQVEDLGAHSLEPEDDYPDFVIPVAQRVASEQDAFGIVIGRSGNGEAIAANKIKRVRAAICMNVEMAKKAREHNDANVLSLGADYISLDEAKEMVKVFLETDFSGEERHKRRLEKISRLE